MMVTQQLEKASSGIAGLDEITSGGLPAGRPTLVCGGPGSGKTQLGVTFLVDGALEHNEPGVLVSFDERLPDLEVNSASLSYNLADLQQRRLLSLDHVYLERQLIVEAGEFDLEGLFIRIGFAVDQIKAKRIVLDSIDTLFAGIANEAVLRSELRRLFGWLKDRGLTAIVTAERGESGITRHGIEEYVSDCVIVLDQRIQDELATRRLRIVKYRGSSHGTNEYPFLIDNSGITVLPITSIGLAHAVFEERVSSGISGLDDMLSNAGFFKGSSILFSGGPGTGKTSIAMQFAASTCSRGEKCLYFTFEESEAQLLRNMRSIGIDLKPHLDSQLLQIKAVRPTLQGLEMHLATILHLVQSIQPSAVIIDPLSALQASGTTVQSRMMIMRLVDYLKSLGTTALYSSVQAGDEETDLNVSSLMDTWISVKNLRKENDLERRIFVIKSRGMSHSSDVRQFLIGAQGLEIAKRKGGA